MEERKNSGEELEPRSLAAFKEILALGVDFVTKCDLFGEPVRLRYKGKTTIKTAFGGLLTFAASFLLMMFIFL